MLFTFPSRYLFTIGHQVVLSLGGWSPQIPPGFLVSQGTQVLTQPRSIFAYGGLTLFAVASQPLPLTSLDTFGVSPTTPPQQVGSVWAISRSLAATKEISIDFFSSGYLDVSVLQVVSLNL